MKTGEFDYLQNRLNADDGAICILSKMSDAGQRASPQASRRSWQQPSTILITGATGGIGAALARSYAQPGRMLILHGRDAARLASLTQECETRGAQVHGVTLICVMPPPR